MQIKYCNKKRHGLYRNIKFTPCYVLFITGGNLKVRQADKYGWEPRKLLEQIVDIYLHLDSGKFAEAIATDEVSFSLMTCKLYVS